MDIKYDRDPNDFTDSLPLLVRAGDFIFVGGQTAAHPVHGLPEEAKLLPRMPWHGSSIQKQLDYLYGNLDGLLKKVGSSQVWQRKSGDRLPPTSTFGVNDPLCRCPGAGFSTISSQ